MLTIPEMVQREAQRYVAVRLPVVIPFDEEVDPAFDELFGAFALAGVAPDGLEFVKFNLVDMPRLEIKTGMTTDGSVRLSGREGLYDASACSSDGQRRRAWYWTHGARRPESYSRAGSRSTTTILRLNLIQAS